MTLKLHSVDFQPFPLLPKAEGRRGILTYSTWVSGSLLAYQQRVDSVESLPELDPDRRLRTIHRAQILEPGRVLVTSNFDLLRGACRQNLGEGLELTLPPQGALTYFSTCTDEGRVLRLTGVQQSWYASAPRSGESYRPQGVPASLEDSATGIWPVEQTGDGSWQIIFSGRHIDERGKERLTDLAGPLFAAAAEYLRQEDVRQLPSRGQPVTGGQRQRVRLFPEWSVGLPLWGDIDPADHLAEYLSPSLRADLVAWNTAWEQLAEAEWEPGFRHDPGVWREHREAGQVLAERTQRELGPGFLVVYRP